MSNVCARSTVISRRNQRRIAAQSDYRFYTGPYRLQNNEPEHPGTRMIYLSYSENPTVISTSTAPKLGIRRRTPTSLRLLMDFIGTLPFKATGRMLIMYDDVARPVSAHRDHIETELCHDFLWFRTNTKKPFFMLNHKTGEKLYVEGYTAWFDSVNQYHGSDPVDGLSFSIRVDGVFHRRIQSDDTEAAV
jgi:hypothetical protein